LVKKNEFEFAKIYELVSEPGEYDAFMRTLLEKWDISDHQEGDNKPDALDAHWGKASTLVDKVTPWRLETESELEKYLSSKLHMMLAVDEDGNIMAANSAARSLYDLRFDAHINDLPLSLADATSLAKQVENVAGGKNGKNHPNNISRFHNQNTKKPILFKFEAYDDKENERRLAVLISNEIYWPQHLGVILQDLFDLTHAEIDVVRLMMGGARVDDIAEKRSTSTTTVRSQLKSSFAKTETPTQLECLRLVIGLAMMHERDEGNLIAARIQAGADTTHYPRESQRQLFKLKNGRQLDYSIFGAQNGSKLKGHVLFFHDQAFGDTWFKEAVVAATRAGIQIIAPLRPGFGRTTLYDGPASDPIAFAPDIKELLDHLEVKKAAIMTVRSGLVHALAAAELMPDRFTNITAANPILPVLSDADLEGTNGYNLLIPKTRLHYPKALRFLCKAGFAFVSAKGPEAFAKAVVRDSPKDYEWVCRAEILPLIIAGLPVHREQGYLGNYGDIAYADDWTRLLAQSPISVRMVIGEDDRNVQWAAARRWASQLAHVDLHVLPDSGYFTQHQHPGQFLDWLKEDLQIR